MKSADACKHDIHNIFLFYMLNAKTDKNRESFYSWRTIFVDNTVVMFKSYLCHLLIHTKRYLYTLPTPLHILYTGDFHEIYIIYIIQYKGLCFLHMQLTF